MPTNRDQTRFTAYFEGRVQGVGFRYSVERLSSDYDVTGFVRNEHDRSVTLLAEGKHDELIRFLNAVKTSHVGRYVNGITLRWGKASNDFQSFSVTYL